MWYDGQLREVMASDTWKKYANNRGFENLARVASLCNRAKWVPLPEDKPMLPLNKREILGDASDSALLRCIETLMKGGADIFRSNYVKVNEPSRAVSSPLITKEFRSNQTWLTIFADHFPKSYFM